MKETWTTIKDFENYEISTLSRIRVIKTGLIRKTQISNRGYVLVHLWSNGKGKKFTVHRLVAKAFIPQIQGKPEVNHKNGDRTDNRVENLEWATPKENIKHAWKSELCRKPKTSISEIEEIKQKYNRRTYQQKTLAQEYGVSIKHIGRILRNELSVLV